MDRFALDKFLVPIASRIGNQDFGGHRVGEERKKDLHPHRLE